MQLNTSAVGVTLLASLAFFTVGLNLLSYGVVQEAVISELRLSLTDSGLLVSVFFLSYSVMQIPAGYAADRWGGERTIAIFAMLTGLAAIGLSFANSFALALAFRVAIGIGTGAMLPAAVRALTNRLVGHDLEVANGFFGAGWGVSQIVALNMLPAVVAISNWRTALVVSGLTTLGASGYAWILARSGRPNRARPGGRPAMKLSEMITKRTLLLVLINVTGIVVPITAITWAPLQFEKLFNISTVDAGRIVSVFGVLTVISSILGGVATRRVGGRLVMILSMVGALSGILLLTNPVSPTIGSLIMALLGFAGTLYISSNFSMVPESAPAGKDKPGVVFGVFNTISNALAFFPPLLTAYILDRTHNFAFLYLAVSVIAAIGLFSAVLLRIDRE